MSVGIAVEELYRVFARYPARPGMEGCPCCTTDEDKAELASAPLRELSARQIQRFAFKAITTWGEVEDYKHYLPRILELAAEPDPEHDIGLEPWLIAGKLKGNGWDGWPAPERKALEAWFIAFWEDILAHYRPGWDGYDDLQFLENVAEAFDDLSPFLDRWADNVTLPALLMLADFIVNELGDLMQAKGEWRNIPRRQALTAWFSDPARGKTLDAGIERHIDDPQAETLAAGLDFWRSMTGRAGG